MFAVNTYAHTHTRSALCMLFVVCRCCCPSSNAIQNAQQRERESESIHKLLLFGYWVNRPVNIIVCTANKVVAAAVVVVATVLSKTSLAPLHTKKNTNYCTSVFFLHIFTIYRRRRRKTPTNKWSTCIRNHKVRYALLHFKHFWAFFSHWTRLVCACVFYQNVLWLTSDYIILCPPCTSPCSQSLALSREECILIWFVCAK